MRALNFNSCVIHSMISLCLWARGCEAEERRARLCGSPRGGSTGMVLAALVGGWRLCEIHREVSRGQLSVIHSLLQPQARAAYNPLQEIKLFRVQMSINLKESALAVCQITKLLFRNQLTVPTSLLMWNGQPVFNDFLPFYLVKTNKWKLATRATLHSLCSGVCSKSHQWQDP